jgi:hypothetical protein
MLIILALLLTAQMSAEDRSELNDAVFGCAAFHAIEAEMQAGDPVRSETQLAASKDWLELAKRVRSDDADAKFAALIADYRQKLKNGDPREMAEDWTELESACRELHKIRPALIKAASESLPSR